MDKAFEKRLKDIRRFYQLLDDLERKCGGKRLLKDCHAKMKWPKRGVYFFFEQEEKRNTSGNGLRVVRVGTHALRIGAKSTLWKRLKQHQGTKKNGGGDHRGSVFRKHVGTALIVRDHWDESIAGTWGNGSSAPREIVKKEVPLEQVVSLYIGEMHILWLEVDDPSGPDSKRGVIERNAIGLLSNLCSPIISVDPPSRSWLGHYARNEEIKRSGLWNVDHVAESYNPAFLDLLETLVSQIDCVR